MLEKKLTKFCTIVSEVKNFVGLNIIQKLKQKYQPFTIAIFNIKKNWVDAWVSKNI